MTLTLRTWLRACWLPLMAHAARAYVAGPALEDAVRVCTSLARQGFASTIGFWNGEGERPRQVAAASLTALDALARQKLDCYLSVKAPPLGFAYDLVAEVLERSGQGNIRIHFDSLGPEAADQTFSLIAAALPHSPGLGCTLPGRWRRSLLDAERAIELGLDVRVVKGQWDDPDEPAIDPRAGFLAVVDRLAGRARQVAVATHDPLLAHEALQQLRAASTPCTLELLLGLPVRPIVRVARAVGVPVRMYVPYGQAYLPYRLAQIQQNPHICWWFVRDLVLGRAFRVPGLCPLLLSLRRASLAVRYSG